MELESQSLIVHHSETTTGNDEAKRVDTLALNGLRGIASISIMLHHYGIWIGDLVVPLFFVISGYLHGISDGLKYGKKHYYQRRIARILPMFYFSNFIMIPIKYFVGSWNEQPPSIMGYNTEWIYYAMTLFVCTSWFGWSNTFRLNGPSWFVSTITFFYWIFPSLFPRLQRIRDKEWWIMAMAWCRVLTCLLLNTLSTLTEGSTFQIVLSASHWRWWPPMALPVFIMGVLAGLRRKEGRPTQDAQQRMEPLHWRRKTDVMAAVIVITFILLTPLEQWGVYKVHALIYAVSPWIWLQFVQSLTFEEGTSWTYRVFTNRFALGFGRISYTLYLMHVPFRFYVKWIYRVISGVDCEKYLLRSLCIMVSIFGSFVLNRTLDEPMRRLLAPTRK